MRLRRGPVGSQRRRYHPRRHEHLCGAGTQPLVQTGSLDLEALLDGHDHLTPASDIYSLAKTPTRCSPANPHAALLNTRKGNACRCDESLLVSARA